MTDRPIETDARTVQGTVVGIDYDADTIAVELSDSRQVTYPFELFDGADVYRPGQRFELGFDDANRPVRVTALPDPDAAHSTLSGYVESVDQDDELAWVYVREAEGWHRKVMPLSLFRESGLARPGAHFFLDLDAQGTPLRLRPDESELEMLPQAVEETKPRWTTRPAAEAEPGS